MRAPLQAEIKDVAAARALAEVMRRRDLVDRVEVSSFHDEALAEIARWCPACAPRSSPAATAPTSWTGREAVGAATVSR